jgi:hypothetical protein
VLSGARKSDLIEGGNDVIISARADLSARASVASIGGARFVVQNFQCSRLFLALRSCKRFGTWLAIATG